MFLYQSYNNTHKPLFVCHFYWQILIPIGGVAIFILLISLVVYVVRHRRLQNSFHLFANSRYDTRLGTTTISTGDLGTYYIKGRGYQ